MIPKEITKQHVFSAIEELRNGEIPQKRQSTKFDLVYEGRSYPPKVVISVAARYATGVELPAEEFSGGDESNTVLKKLGFEIREKSAWTERECYFAVWVYDQLDLDRTLVKTHLFRHVSDLTGRSVKSVEWKIQNVSHFDPRPRQEKPISEAPNAQKLIGDVFRRYWKDREHARALYPQYVEESYFNVASQNEYSGEMDSDALKTLMIEEGAEGHYTSKTRKRSVELLERGRNYFRSLEPDNKLRCHACGFSKPEPVDREVVELHHTEMISEIDKEGRRMSLHEAIKMLLPLCPTCHRIAHTSTPPLSVVAIKSLLKSGSVS